MATQAKRDYYEILSVTRTATEQEIKSSYRKLAMQYHPDRNPGNSEAEEKFKECTEAYSVLMDADKRARYDQYGHAAVNGGGFSGFDPSNFADVSDIFGDIFSDFFGVNVGGGRRGRSRCSAAAMRARTLHLPLKKPLSARRRRSRSVAMKPASNAKARVQRRAKVLPRVQHARAADRCVTSRECSASPAHAQHARARDG